jgi:pentatricopeptide repeat protein
MKQNGLTPNNVTYGCLIDACVKNNFIHQAVEVYESMLNDGVPMNTIILTTLIKGFARVQDLNSALNVF